MNILNRLIDFIKSYSDIVTVFVLLIISELIFKGIMNFRLITPRAELFSIACCMIIVSFMFIFEYKVRKVLEIIILFMIDFVLFAQLLHFEYFNNFFSFNKLTVFSELVEVRGEIFEIFQVQFLLVFIPLIILMVILVIRGKVVTENVYKIHLRILFSVVIFLGGILGYKLTLSILVDDENWALSDVYLYESLYSRTRAVNRLGVYAYSYRDSVEVYASLTRQVNEEDIKMIDEYINNQTEHQNNDFTGIYEGKNLVLVLAESLGYAGVNEELTPTLYMMSQEGIYCENHYQPIFQSATGDSEFISVTSQIPSIDFGTTSYTFHRNHYSESMANLFRSEGYSSNSFHSFISNFYNREIFHDSLGFETFYDIEKLELYKWEGYQDAINWQPDELLLKNTMRITEENDRYPFFDFVISVSGHMPYVTNRVELKPYVEIIEDKNMDISEEATAYYAAQMTLDKGLEVLIEELDAMGELENTVIAVYGDHYPYGLSEDAYDELFDDEYDFEKFRAPFMIWSPDGVDLEIEKTTSSFDIYPTLMNLFGIDVDNTFMAGVDILSDESSMVYFLDRSWLNDDVYFNSSNNNITILNDSITETEIESLSNGVRETFDISQKILENDYYAHR